MRKSFGLVVAVIMLYAGLSLAGQWSGNDNTTEPISRTGNVGVGTTPNSSATLHLFKASSGMSPIINSLLVLENSSSAFLQFLTTNGGQQAILFGNQGVTPVRNTDGWLRYVGGGTPLMEFKVNNAVRMTIKSDGKVGIGTASPTEMLDVNGTVQSNYLTVKAQDGVNEGGELLLKGSGTNPEWHADVYQNRFRLFTDAEKFTVTSESKVGVGTGTPNAKMHVVQSSLENFGIIQMLQTTGSDYDGPKLCFVDGPSAGKTWTIGSSAAASDAGFEIREDGNTQQWGTSVLKIAPGGKVGIGTDNPTSKLHIVGSETSEWGNNAGVTIKNTSSTNEWYLRTGAPGTATPDGGFSISDMTSCDLAITADGKVGIGTTTPAERLSINGNLAITDANGDKMYIGELGGNAGRFDFGFQGGAAATQNVLFWGGEEANGWKTDNFTVQSDNINLVGGNNALVVSTPGGSSPVGAMSIDVNTFGNSSNAENSYFFRVRDVAGGNTHFYIRGDGNVGIGTTNPTYKLAVNGTIRTKEVIVETGWSDFVFAEGYKLRTLSEVEQYIKANKHLPDMPSEDEVKANGVSLGETQARLLQKVEELTLYMIELKKENDVLKKQVAALEAK
jgi:hypothetical protein